MIGRFLSRLFPYPMLSLGLLAMWLMLNETISVGHILLGGMIGIGAALAMAALSPSKPHIRNPWAVIKLVAIVVADVLRSNLAVASIVISGKKRESTSGFLELPLDLRDRNGLAVLACVITATPGSSWLDYDSAKSVVLIHVLDLVDADDWIKTIKTRYETLLLEIFR